MKNRWVILAVLFLARTTMAFQFQSVAVLSPLIIDRFGVTLTEIGLLIGLYLAPGVIVSIPGGAIAARVGDKRIIGLGMGLMLAGAVIITLSAGWNGQIIGRVVAGTGGIVLNVVMTKMVLDWFAGREISTAMALFINSWPLGIALALFTLPIFVAAGGLALASTAVAIAIAGSLALFLIVYTPAPGAVAASTSVKRVALPVYALTLVGLVWALYNAALAMVFSFGPTVLSARGMTLSQSGSSISLFMVIFAVAVPLGGVIADRTGRRDTIIVVSLLSFAVFSPLILVAPIEVVPLILMVVGGLFGLAAGPIIGLPSGILAPESRAFGMGVYFAIYYFIMMAAPPLAGAMADVSANTSIALLFGSGMLIAGLIALALFRRTT